MKAKMSDLGKVRLVALDGKIGWGSGMDELTELVKRLLSEGHREIVLNLTDVTLMDSGGVGAMATCRKRALESDAQIAIVIPPTSKIPLVVQSCLLEMFKSFREENEALASFSTEAPR